MREYSAASVQAAVKENSVDVGFEREKYKDGEKSLNTPLASMLRSAAADNGKEISYQFSLQLNLKWAYHLHLQK